jgi:hypothetical protein
MEHHFEYEIRITKLHSLEIVNSSMWELTDSNF